MTETAIIPPAVLITGPTSGIGARMLDCLLRHPARPRLVLLARDDEARELALARARDRGLVADGFPIDLADLASVQQTLESLTRAVGEGRIAPIDVALLNAGAQFASRRKVGAQGYELTFAINVIAQHLILRGLEPLLSARGHAVFMGSSTHRGKRASFNLVPDPRWQPPEELAAPEPPSSVATTSAAERERGALAYATSKLALVTLAHDWASRLAKSGRRLNTYDPGLVAGTGLGKDLPGPMYWVWRHLMPAMAVLPGASTPARSGRHAVELGLGDAFDRLNDGYVEIGRLTAAEAVTFDPGRRQELWEWLEAAVATWLPHNVETGR